MEHGLCVVQIAITYYRAITIVGWARRKRGDEWELVPGARIITRKKGTKIDWNGLDTLADQGLGEKYQCHPPMAKPEPLHRLMVRRFKSATVKNWPDCPKPKGWKNVTDAPE